MPQPYINGRALKPHGSGFYYSSKGGLDPTKTTAPPIGLELIARHKDHPTDDTQAAEIDIACPAGSLTGAQKLPNGKDSVPEPGACKANSTIDIPYKVDYYAGTSSLTFAGHEEPMPYNNIHADYFDAEHMRKLVEFCINAKNAGSPNCK